jgi:hypothetical protein
VELALRKRRRGHGEREQRQRGDETLHAVLPK